MSRKRNNTIYALFYCSNIVWSIISLEVRIGMLPNFFILFKSGKNDWVGEENKVGRVSGNTGLFSGDIVTGLF